MELKNGETFNGHLVGCDNFMNLTLKEVYQTSAVRGPGSRGCGGGKLTGVWLGLCRMGSSSGSCQSATSGGTTYVCRVTSLKAALYADSLPL